jgi:hypothetical protein
VKDGAHTHGHGGGLDALAVIGAGAMLVIGVAEAVARVWPYVVAAVGLSPDCGPRAGSPAR